MIKFRFLLCFLCSALFILGAQSAEATNGHQLSAIGAYQQGMGGATTAAPYDASTSVSNPAGMAMIGNRTDFSFQTFFPTRETEFAGGQKTTGGSNMYLVPAIGWTAPLDDRNDLFFGGGMYGVSGMGVDYDTVAAPFMTGFGFVNPQAHIYSQYQFWKMAPTVAWKSGNVALGFALNLDYQAFGFEQYYTGTGGAYMGFDLSEMQGTMGYGASVGIIYEPVPAFRVGATYISKQNFGNFKWRLSAGDVVDPVVGSNTDGIYKMDLDFPQQAAIGFAIRPFRSLLWTIDVKWINYSDTYDIVYLKGAFAGGSQAELNFGWDDVRVYATGLQIDIAPTFAIRAGYNYSSSPIKKEDAENNLAFPAIVKQRVAGGFTYRFGRHWEMTMAYMKAFRETLVGDYGTKISLEETGVDFEISYRF
jgi:long-chain fatty acid transport protein